MTTAAAKQSRAGVLALILVLLAGPFGVAGCMVVPRAMDRDPIDCDTVSVPWTVELVGDASGFNCSGSGEACLVFLVAIPMASLIISSTFVLVGNTVYFIERGLRCDGLPQQRFDPAGDKGSGPG